MAIKNVISATHANVRYTCIIVSSSTRGTDRGEGDQEDDGKEIDGACMSYCARNYSRSRGIKDVQHTTIMCKKAGKSRAVKGFPTHNISECAKKKSAVRGRKFLLFFLPFFFLSLFLSCTILHIFIHIAKCINASKVDCKNSTRNSLQITYSADRL